MALPICSSFTRHRFGQDWSKVQIIQYFLQKTGSDAFHNFFEWK